MKFIKFSTTKLVFVLMTLGALFFTYDGKIDPKDFTSAWLVVLYHYFNKDTKKEIPVEQNG